MSDTLKVASFFALVDEKRKKVPKYIETEPKLRTELVALFEGQAAELYGPGVERIPFDPKFKADPEHIFEIRPFELPEPILNAVKNTNGVGQFKLSADGKLGLKGIFASAYDPDSGAMRILFQRSGPSRILTVGRNMFISSGVFRKLDDPGLSLDSAIVAIYDSGSLLFRVFTAVNPLLDLKDHFVEATSEEVTGVLKHSKFHAEDVEGLTSLCDMTMRKRVAFIKASGVLEAASVRTVCSTLKKMFDDIDIKYKTKDGKDTLQLPTNRKDLKRLLNHLCEFYYEGPLTGRKYEANSHRNLA